VNPPLVCPPCGDSPRRRIASRVEGSLVVPEICVKFGANLCRPQEAFLTLIEPRGRCAHIHKKAPAPEWAARSCL
jgi:hypothetical protein